MFNPRDRSEQELELMRYRALKEETTDPVAFRLLDDIVSELEPLAMVVDLARRYPDAKIILSGRNGSAKLDDASALKKYFVSLEIPPERLIAEGQSRTVAESSQFDTQEWGGRTRITPQQR